MRTILALLILVKTHPEFHSIVKKSVRKCSSVMIKEPGRTRIYGARESSGIMTFASGSIAEDPGEIAAVKRV
jgi:hypothetical protein